MSTITMSDISKDAAMSVSDPITASISFSVITVVQCNCSVENIFSNLVNILGNNS